MGRIGAPFYGEDVGSAVETVNKITKKVVKHTFTIKDVDEFQKATKIVTDYMVKDLKNA